MRNNHGGKQLGSDKKPLVVHLPKDIHAKVFEAAGRQGLTASDWARLLIRQALEKETM